MVPSGILGQNDFLIPLDSSQRGASDGINVTTVAVTSKTWQAKNCSVLKRHIIFCSEEVVLFALIFAAKGYK